jgi:hypothetical protein
VGIYKTFGKQTCLKGSILRTLIPRNSLEPRPANLLGFEHDIDLHRVVPRLRDLISMSLAAEVLVDDHEFDYSISAKI